MVKAEWGWKKWVKGKDNGFIRQISDDSGGVLISEDASSPIDLEY